MTSTREAILAETMNLFTEGWDLLTVPIWSDSQGFIDFRHKYQSWYTRAIALVRTAIPERLREFTDLYSVDKRKSIDCTTYSICDYLHGIRPRDVNEEQARGWAASRIHQQVSIVKAVEARVTSILSDLRGVLAAELYDGEIESSRGLQKLGHLRAAGAVAGFVLEHHLKEVCMTHEVPLGKKNPCLSDYNEALKAGEIVDTTNWRWIQRLADIRNLCDHAKDREPTTDEVSELIDGVDKAIKTIA